MQLPTKVAGFTESYCNASLVQLLFMNCTRKAVQNTPYEVTLRIAVNSPSGLLFLTVFAQIFSLTEILGRTQIKEFSFYRYTMHKLTLQTGEFATSYMNFQFEFV